MKPDKLWETTLGELELSLSKAIFNTWFKDTYISDFSDTKITIAVPSIFVKEWLAKKYEDTLFKILKKHCLELKKINFKVQASNKKHGFEEVIKPVNQNKTTELIQKENDIDNKAIVRSASLSPHYVFTSFVVGNNNKLAHAASLAVCKKPGKVYNPLFIYGDSGLGKTHLMQAIGNEIQNLFPKKKILYVNR
jgi:chromosomal replication initiator protein